MFCISLLILMVVTLAFAAYDHPSVLLRRMAMIVNSLAMFYVVLLIAEKF